MRLRLRTRAVPTCAIGLALFFSFGAVQHAQDPPASTHVTTKTPRIEEQVEVVAVTPIDGTGVPKHKVPANVQVFKAETLDDSTADDVAGFLAARANSAQISEAQGGSFQPDVMFRGFTASPLLGASEGVAVYQNGVRINDPFGDTVQWDALPSAAVSSMTLMPGSNPMFGLNALGGALSVRTKDGFDFPQHRVSFTAGAFGQQRIEAESGAHGERFGYYVAGPFHNDDGWRDFSPSTVRRLFGDIAWRGSASSANVNITTASNDLTGNGAAPVALLEEDRSAVFTHPDTTDHDIVLLTVNLRRTRSAHFLTEAAAYYRHSRTGTSNGDAAEEDEASEFDAVINTSRTRTHGAGSTVQVTRSNPLFGAENILIAGGGIDYGTTDFGFASEFAELTPDRGTLGTGVFDDDAAVALRSRTASASAFVSDTWSITSRMAASGSARITLTGVQLRDQIGTELSGDHRFWRINPAVGLTYQVRPRLTAYGSIAESSRVPSPVELTCADPDAPCRLPNAFVSDPPLNQVLARTLEGGVRGNTSAVEWTLAFYATRARDDIIFVSSGRQRGTGHFQNVPHTNRSGVEMGISYRGARVSAYAIYSFQRATFGTALLLSSPNHPLADGGEMVVQAGDRLPSVPAHDAKAGVTIHLSGRTAAAMAARTQSSQFFRGDEGNLLPPVESFGTVDADVRHRITRNLTAVAQANNLFDTRYSTFGVLGNATLLGEAFDDARFLSPGRPRTIWIGVQAKF